MPGEGVCAGCVNRRCLLPKTAPELTTAWLVIGAGAPDLTANPGLSIGADQVEARFITFEP
jgi:hypothetical protein